MANSKNNKDTVDSSRRKFLKKSGIAAGGVAGGAILGGLLGNPFSTKDAVSNTATQEPVNYTEARQFFKRQEDFDVLSMATERIFPEDENGPGAIGLGVPYFIDKQLAGPWGRNADVYMKAPFQNGDSPLSKGDIFLQAVRKMNEISREMHDESFPNLNEEQQIEIMEDFENDEVQLHRVSSAEFFNLLRQSVLEGAYSDPLHGGNKNMEGWKMKEYPGAQLSYRHMMEEDESIDQEFIKIDPVSLGSR